MRASPWPFLTLLLVGCGGSHGGASSPTPLLRVARSDGAAYGEATDGGPRLAAYDARTKTVAVRSTAGVVTVPVPGTAFFDLALTGDFLLETVRVNEVDGTRIVDLRTLASRFDPGETPRFADGGRVVWTTASASVVVEELAAGVRTPVVLGADDTVTGLRGERLLVQNRPPFFGDGLAPTAYRTTDLAGTKLADLPIPPGYDSVTVAAIAADGRAVGSAIPNGFGGDDSIAPTAPFLWSAVGVPTALDGVNSESALSVADDGTVLAVGAGSRLRVFRAGVWRGLNVAGYPATISRDGRTAFVADDGEGGVAAYATGGP